MFPTRDRTTVAVAVVVAIALVARLVGLGNRAFHWDEARVGYWTLRYGTTGLYEYRPVAGGPLLYHVGRWTMAVVPASDFVARLPVALIGGLLPASALLFRGRLRDDETVAVAIVLAFTPLTLYYGRFLRADTVLAAVALVAVGTTLLWIDTDRDRYLYATAALVPVAAATSGFVVATFVLVIVSAFLVVDHRRIDGTGASVPRAVVSRGRWLLDRTTPLARALFVFLGVWAILFTPRGWGLLLDPTTFASRTFADPVRAFHAVRVSGREGTEFLPFIEAGGLTLLATAGPLVAIALFGFLADRYRLLGGPPRPLVAFTAFWAGVGTIGYPVVAEVLAPWTLVHVLVPLAIPAGVGLAAVGRYGRNALVKDGRGRSDAARATAALLVLLAVGVHAGVVIADDVYGEPAPGSSMAQFAQPADDLEPLVAEMDAALSMAEDRDDRDATVLFVGQRYYLSDEGATASPPITPGGAREAWGERLPLPWYVERTGAETDSVPRPAEIQGQPAVVFADPAHESELEERLPHHESRTIRLALWNREVVVFLAG